MLQWDAKVFIPLAFCLFYYQTACDLKRYWAQSRGEGWWVVSVLPEGLTPQTSQISGWLQQISFRKFSILSTIYIFLKFSFPTPWWCHYPATFWDISHHDLMLVLQQLHCCPWWSKSAILVSSDHMPSCFRSNSLLKLLVTHIY